MRDSNGGVTIETFNDGFIQSSTHITIQTPVAGESVGHKPERNGGITSSLVPTNNLEGSETEISLIGGIIDEDTIGVSTRVSSDSGRVSNESNDGTNIVDVALNIKDGSTCIIVRIRQGDELILLESNITTVSTLLVASVGLNVIL